MGHRLLGKGKWVFIDWTGVWAGYGADQQGRDLPRGFLVPYGVELRVHKPKIDHEPVLVPEHPWESNGIHPFSTFLECEGRFRCWYHVRLNDDVGLAYAESNDGVNWTKPTLGLREFNGSKKNNLVALDSRGGVEQTRHVFIDPSAPPAERYKMVSSCDNEDLFAIYGDVSPDGLSWTRLPGDPIILKNRSDTQNIGTYDEILKKYVVFTRQRDNQYGRRGVNRSESPDFQCFPPSEPVLCSTPLDPPDWDYYTSGYSRWPGAVNAHVMRFAVYHRTQDSVDVHLATSGDGRIWHRPLGREAWLEGERDLAVTYKCLYACAGVLRTASGKWSSYVGGSPEGHNHQGGRSPGSIWRVASREDGFMSLSSVGRGEFCTLPFTLEADEIRLNIRAGAARCEIVAADGGEPAGTLGSNDHPVPVWRGFSMDDCAVIKGDHVNVPIVWNGDLKSLRGREVQLRFDLFNADLHAINFT